MLGRPDITSFALGQPAPELFPVEAFIKASREVLASNPGALSYNLPLKSLKAHIVQLMAMRGVVCNESQIVVTTGAQQAMAIVSSLLLNRGQQLLVEEIIYEGIQLAVRPNEPEILTVPTDLETGMDTEEVEWLLRKGSNPAFIYAIGDGHNPLGVTLSYEKREHLVRLAQRYGVPILEDDVYGLLHYEGKPVSPMRAMDERMVFYAGSFSKILAPGLRIGWLVAPEETVPLLSSLKYGNDIDTSTFSQQVTCAYLASGGFPEHVKLLCEEYRIRRDAMATSIAEHFPDCVRVVVPSNGMFMWLELPTHLDALELLRFAIEAERVGFMPGVAFAVTGAERASHSIRLSFPNCPAPQIREGIARLGRIVKASCS
jgi:2-aminoadipate transaminase